MIERLAAEIEEKYLALTEELADPEILRDQSRYAELSKAHSDLEDSYRLAVAYREAQTSLEEAESMLDEGGLDPEMREFLVEEKTTARDRLEELEHELRLAVLEKDPRDAKNAIVEIRAGAGAMRRRCSQPRCNGCSCATRSVCVSRPRSSRRRSRRSVESKRSF